MRRRNQSRVRDMTLLSGWLFADLLLGLALIFLVSTPAGSFAPLPPTATFTPLPTYTPNPTYTVLPTYTPNPTYTILPTYTANPTYTVPPTYTPDATYTPLPTYTAQPTGTPRPTYTALPTYTPRPAPTASESQDTVLSQDVVEFRIVADVDALLGGDAATRAQERDRLRDVIRQQLASLATQRAGIVLTFGTAPSPAEGGRLSQEMNALLQDTMPATFTGAVMRDFHNIADVSQRGVVEIEVYVIVQGQ